LRWLIAGCIGIFHGLYFALFLDESAYRAKWVLTGAALAELAFMAVAGSLLLAALRGRYRKIPASVLLAAGLGWFVLRLGG
ncbi:MAG: hypothetical protein JWO80_1989, partial [Bryobacterales bacterium]|nr:hypothetical protein [Bryobacterales bacterium]